MFVKPGACSQKLLDKKSLRTTVYGDSKGLMFFKKFMVIVHLIPFNHPMHSL